MKTKFIAVLLLVSILLCGCNRNPQGNGGNGGNIDIGGNGGNTNIGGNGGGQNTPPPQDNRPGFGGDSVGNPGVDADDNTQYGESLDSLGVYEGYFDGDVRDITIKCISGTPGCYKVEGDVITFTAVRTESTYSITGKFAGSIVIDTGDAYKFDLELCDFTLVSSKTNPITVLSGNEISIQAKKDTKNFIYDMRSALTEDDIAAHSGAIFSEVDLEMSGKGNLVVLSENNNGIHSKKDLQVKNLGLIVSCKDNALKGNDSVQFENANATLIATIGDTIKTNNSDISGKGNQRGTVSFVGGSYNIYAACDGIDSAYNVEVQDATTVINIYTDKYSTYSNQVISTPESIYYLRASNKTYTYSVMYYNSDSDFVWVNADYHTFAPTGKGGNYYYYSFPRNTEYSKIRVFAYSSAMAQGQDSEYAFVSDYITVSEAYDTITMSNRSGNVRFDWANYSSGSRPGGMNDGNTDKGDHSAKGIKACNEILFYAGVVNIKSYDDALHAKNDTPLENEKTPTGNVIIKGGSISIYSNDDGIHADGNLVVENGYVNIVNSYEGIEGETVKISGGTVSVVSKDDGVNGMAYSGAAITVSGGMLYVYSGGDGVDSNSRTSYGGIVFSGGKTLIISTSGGNSAIDSEAGYKYTGGKVVAIMPRGGMSNESTRCQGFESVGKKTEVSLTKGNYLVCQIDGETLTVNIPVSISSLVVVLGSSGALIRSSSSSGESLSEGEFIWK